MDPFKRNYHTDYDLADPHCGCPVARSETGAGYWVVNRRMTAHPLAAFTDPLELTGAWEGIARRTYIRCERFQIALGEPLITRLEQDPGWRTERWDCAHRPNIVAPQRVIAAVVGMR